MKHGRTLALALTVSLLAPLPLPAQGGRQERRGGMGAMSARLLIEQGSVEYLVTKAADIQLTADQTKQFEAIGSKWALETREARERIAAMLPQRSQGTGTDREAMMQRMQEARPLMEKLAADDRAALDSALQLLGEEQRTRARALLEERAQSARPRRPPGR